MTRLRMQLTCVAGVAALAACSDGSPTSAPVQSAQPRAGTLVTAFSCSVTPAARKARCVPARPRGSARGDVFLWDPYFQLTSRNPHYYGAQFFTFEVAVTNLIPQPIGTTDGVTVDASGIRVFFQSGPTVTTGSGTITVDPDGIGTFTASNQRYYQYNEILGDSAQSSWKTWTFEMPPTVGTFEFTVLVIAPVQFPSGWVGVAPGGVSLGVSSTTQLSATAYDARGDAEPGASFTWSSSNPAVATVSSSGLVTGVSNGHATITATSGSRVGTAGVTVS
jgi:Bacterial Ig-like domain (group 2)